jgi:site-specific DNA recombinase
MVKAIIRAAAYLRMSDDRHEDSPERQRSQVQPYAARKGYAIVREYLDEGIPGDELEKREQFCQMLRDAKAGHFEVILCDDKDRFGRFDTIDYGAVVAPLRRKGVWLETVAQGRVDWDSLAGRMMDALLQEMKAAESKTTSRRVLTRMLMKALRGEWTGGTPPDGYALEEVPGFGKRLVPGDPRQVRAVQLIFDLYGNRGFSLEDVRQELYLRAVPDPKGDTAWKKPTIRYVLKNRKYVGDLPWNTRHCGKWSEYASGQVSTSDRRIKGRRNNPAEWVVMPDVHEALIDRELFERVQVRLADNAKRSTPLPRGGDFLLSGLPVCGHCGCRMFAQNDRRRGGRFYYCSRYHQQGKHACGYNRIAEARLVPFLIKTLQERVLAPENLAALRDEIRRQDEEEASQGPARADAIRAQLAELETMLKRGAGRLAMLPDDLAEEFAANLREWNDERRRLTADLEQLGQGTGRADMEEGVRLAEEELWRMREALTGDDLPLLREVLRELISRVELWFTSRRTAKLTRWEFTRGRLWIRLDRKLMNPVGARSRATSGSSCSSPRPAGSSTSSRARSSAPA